MSRLVFASVFRCPSAVCPLLAVSSVVRRFSTHSSQQGSGNRYGERNKQVKPPRYLADEQEGVDSSSVGKRGMRRRPSAVARADDDFIEVSSAENESEYEDDGGVDEEEQRDIKSLMDEIRNNEAGKAAQFKRPTQFPSHSTPLSSSASASSRSPHPSSTPAHPVHKSQQSQRNLTDLPASQSHPSSDQNWSAKRHRWEQQQQQRQYDHPPSYTSRRSSAPLKQTPSSRYQSVDGYHEKVSAADKYQSDDMSRGRSTERRDRASKRERRSNEDTNAMSRQSSVNPAAFSPAFPATRPNPRSHYPHAPSYRIPAAQGEYIWGYHPVVCALRGKRRSAVYALYLQEKTEGKPNGTAAQVRVEQAQIRTIVKLAEAQGIPVQYANKQDMNLLSKDRPHNGFILDAAPLQPPTIHDATSLLSTSPTAPTSSTGTVWVLLDEVMDPQNLGAMLRSCHYFQVQGVLICKKNSASLSATTSKASSGAMELLNLHYINSTPRFLHKCSPAEWRVIGLSLGRQATDLREVLTQSQLHAQAAPITPTDTHHPKHTIIVVGNEGRGLRPLVQQSCHQLVKILPALSTPTQQTSLNTQSGDIEAEGVDMAEEEEEVAAAEALGADEVDEDNPYLRLNAERANEEDERAMKKEVDSMAINNTDAISPPVSSPKHPLVDSLNVSNALAIALFHICR